MTLERHRSKLIPDVNYSGDGTLFVTDRQGTFPLRGQGKERADVREMAYSAPDAETRYSYRSYDAYRDAKKRKFKQRSSPSRYGQEIQNISGTISTTHSSSLGRRLRRSKRRYSGTSLPRRVHANGHGPQRSSSSAGGSTGRIRSGPPKMSPEYAASLRERRERRRDPSRGPRSELRTIQDSPRNSIRESKDFSGDYGSRNGSVSHLMDPRLKKKKVHDDRLPFMVFLIDGVLFLIVGIIRIITSHWHEYLCPVWTGILILLMGIIGARHRGHYLAKGKNGGFIFCGVVGTVALLVSSFIVLQVLVPLLTGLASGVGSGALATSVLFSNINRTLSSVGISPSMMTWISLALDLSTTVLIFIGFFALTASLMALSNHWDASYDVTGDCDHRGNPRFFSPMVQAVLGLVSTYIGLVIVTIEATLAVDHANLYSPAWAGLLVILAGVVNFCFGKRIDKLSLGAFATFLEFLALVACGVATVFATIGIVTDSTEMQQISDTSSSRYKKLVATMTAGGAFACLMAVNVVFIVGIVFRNFRHLCCRECCSHGDEEESRQGSTRF